MIYSLYFQFLEREKSFMKFNDYCNHPALRIIARPRNKANENHVALFKDASALLALENIELPLAARPPIPSPLGL